MDASVRTVYPSAFPYSVLTAGRRNIVSVRHCMAKAKRSLLKSGPLSPVCGGIKQKTPVMINACTPLAAQRKVRPDPPRGMGIQGKLK